MQVRRLRKKPRAIVRNFSAMTGHQIEQAAHSPIGRQVANAGGIARGLLLSETLPDSEGTVYTATGTVAHTIGEAELVRRIEKSRGAIITGNHGR